MTGYSITPESTISSNWMDFILIYALSFSIAHRLNLCMGFHPPAKSCNHTLHTDHYNWSSCVYRGQRRRKKKKKKKKKSSSFIAVYGLSPGNKLYILDFCFSRKVSRKKTKEENVTTVY